jgi:transposase
MQRSFRFSSLVPSGLTVESVTCVEEAIIVTARAQGDVAKCPLCKTASRRVHSRYRRDASDLPCAGRRVRLSLSVRRFHCEAVHCRRRIFAERFDEAVLGERSRRTARLDHVVHHLGLALGGRPAASFASRLLLPVSNDTLLRVVRRRTRRRAEAPRVVGVDDWAFRRNHRYGTLICDLERREVVALLPDREIATVAAWLADHSSIETLSRDRGGGYGEAAAKALPSAVQVADRWHLMENASAAFLDAVRKSMRAIRAAIGATVVDPELLTCAERLQYQGYLRREETNAAILALAKAGAPIKRIARQAVKRRHTLATRNPISSEA